MAKAEVIRSRASERDLPAQAVALIASYGPREALVQSLQEGGLSVAVFPSSEQLLDCDTERPIAIVLWVRDTMSSMAALLAPHAARFPDTPIVIACEEIQRWEVRAALAAGAAGVVTLENLHSALSACLRAVLAQQICVPRGNWRQVEPPVLSTREKQILGLVVMGYMNSEIASRLFLAESTVKSHLSSAFGKLGVRSRNEAVDLILNPERGFGMGILALGGEPLDSVAATSP